MSNVKTYELWKRFEDIDIGSLNDLNSDVFEAKYSQDQSLRSTLAEIFTKHYSFDITSGTGPYAAVVLEVLSGPQVKNEGKTKGRINTTSLNIDAYPNIFLIRILL